MEKIQSRLSDSPKRLIEESNHLITYIGPTSSLFLLDQLDINPRDILLICTDGISENIGSNFLNKTILKMKLSRKLIK